MTTNARKQVILVLGGARSGKSAFAEQLAQAIGGDHVLFVATAQARDAEMARRIQAHRQSRPDTWRTLEAPRRLGSALKAHYKAERVILVDCLTLLVANVLEDFVDPFGKEATTAVHEEIDELLTTVQTLPVTTILISNEVGWGLVPPTPLGRAYRDLLGWVNQHVATVADEVYLLVAGLSVPIKTLAQQVHKETHRP